ncbi:hypothetical protein Pint_26631 [Pistacia integerrima]|uniref:Uncharacterized protein n=1 Tax=Pistacia integerrima TaxID=434235 RepID=A0ACC0YR10_9ROSI|nr:hypothetical protein Pint_26631 [Pistacia integerrima]
MAAMARLLVLFAVVLVPVLVNGQKAPFTVRGRVYCDTCRCGFETSASTYIHGAKVRIECKDRDTLQLKYSKEGETDSKGTYNIQVEDDHLDQICYAKLVSSPMASCKTPGPGRDHSQVILTRSNGAVSNLHYANALGFLRNQALSECAQFLKQYQLQDDVI